LHRDVHSNGPPLGLVGFVPALRSLLLHLGDGNKFCTVCRQIDGQQNGDERTFYYAMLDGQFYTSFLSAIYVCFQPIIALVFSVFMNHKCYFSVTPRQIIGAVSRAMLFLL
jgi:hypothetical protein